MLKIIIKFLIFDIKKNKESFKEKKFTLIQYSQEYSKQIPY